MIVPKTVARSGSKVSCDFGEVVAARPVIEVKGRPKSRIKYRTYGNAADAVDSVFEIPDLSYREKATDLMERIVLVTVTHESKTLRKFRYLDIEPSDGADVLRTGGILPSSAAASSPHPRDRPW